MISIKKKKILYIISNATLGGSQESFLLLNKHINQKNYDSLCMSVDGPFIDKLRLNKINYVLFRNRTISKKNIIGFVLLVCKMYLIIKKHNISIIHANDIHSVQYSVLAAKLARIYCVCHMRSPFIAEMLSKKIHQSLINCCEAIIAISKHVKNELESIGILGNKIHIVYNALDLGSEDYSSHCKFEFRRQNYIANGDIFVGTVGRINPVKGLDTFIKSIPFIIQAIPNAKFVIVGDANTTEENLYFDYLKKMRQELEIEQRLIFAGYREDVVHIMKCLEVLVVPSKEEPFGRVVIEAMAAETPVVASEVGGIPEIIKHGINGLLIPPNDAKSIANAVIRLVKDTGLREKLIQESRKTVKEQFSLQMHINKIAAIYEQILSENSND
jgi:glycosyltransferase involved in cell wall biosynthesis